MSNLTKIAGAILPELNDRTLTIEGKALRIYDNEGRLRFETIEAMALLESRAKRLAKVAKELQAKVLADLQAGVEVAPNNHTLELGTKTSTSCSWQGYAFDLGAELGRTEKELKEDIKQTRHYKSDDKVPCLVIDGRKK